MDLQLKGAVAPGNFEALFPHLQLFGLKGFAFVKAQEIPFLGVNASNTDVLKKVEDHLHRFAAMLTIDHPKDMPLRKEHFKRGSLFGFVVDHPVPANVSPARVTSANVHHE